jgi:hypothetical protein
VEFEWDPKKAASNLRKHGVAFDEASTAFGDQLSITVPDPAHSRREKRFVLIGTSARERVLVVVHTDRDGRVRIISARRATKKERAQYKP